MVRAPHCNKCTSRTVYPVLDNDMNSAACVCVGACSLRLECNSYNASVRLDINAHSAHLCVCVVRQNMRNESAPAKLDIFSVVSCMCACALRLCWHGQLEVRISSFVRSFFFSRSIFVVLSWCSSRACGTPIYTYLLRNLFIYRQIALCRNSYAPVRLPSMLGFMWQ